MPARKRARYRATETIFLPGRRMIDVGAEIDGDDPALKGREHLFTRLEYVEQATAAPGEKRHVATKPKAKK